MQYAIWSIASAQREAAARICFAFAAAAESASTATSRALHAHGGYGLSLEYDIQLYYRRAKSWALAGGDPRDELLRAASRLWDEAAEPVALPDAGPCALDFSLGPETDRIRAEARAFFERALTPELREKAHFSWDGHDADFQKQLASAGLLFPNWPREYGGRDRAPTSSPRCRRNIHRAGWSTHAIITTAMVGATLMKFASEELKREVLPRILAGEAVTSLGYTEPASGSDVAAAQTRAARDGENWVIDGQKMFTSGADRAQYVFLLTRSDPSAAKHKGLTMFLVPLDLPGIKIQPVHTLSDERTNVTYYNAVRVPDRYRVGEIRRRLERPRLRARDRARRGRRLGGSRLAPARARRAHGALGAQRGARRPARARRRARARAPRARRRCTRTCRSCSTGARSGSAPRAVPIAAKVR